LDARVARVIELMEANSATPLSVAELALAVNLCPSYLTRLFREETGRSPARYGKDRRLDHAHQLLLSTFLSVKEVMAAVGWNDPSHFGREFKRRFGVSPRELRGARRG
jgi:transcriptional regulator GlxA family with amidase domain